MSRKSDDYLSDKVAFRSTIHGQVPLTLGKYGMTVEQYLEWQEFKRTHTTYTEQSENTKPKGN